MFKKKTQRSFTTTLLTQLYVRVGYLLSCGQHLHHCITSLRGGAGTAYLSGTPKVHPRFLVGFVLLNH
jgi:hypothetical protein